MDDESYSLKKAAPLSGGVAVDTYCVYPEPNFSRAFLYET